MFVIHRKSIKKLDLKNLKSNQYSSPANKDRDDLASPATYPQNGHGYYITLLLYKIKLLYNAMLFKIILLIFGLNVSVHNNFNNFPPLSFLHKFIVIV